ncbi:tellurium resistance TerZ family protein [Vibrio profundum]|uniref:TerD family protein n=1 Tax=Vibrio profundum TaxID=2910247 RepID=UPI003D10E9BF
MSINLEKNSTICLTKKAPALSNITVGLGWDVAKSKGLFGALLGAKSIDLDASCVLIDESKQIVDTVWFQKLRSMFDAVVHQGDNLTGAGDGDDEQIKIALNKIPQAVKYLAITVNSFSGQSFKSVANAYCRVIDENTGEMCRFTLTEQGDHTGLFIGLFTREGSEWMFTSKGVPLSGRTVKSMSDTLVQYL